MCQTHLKFTEPKPKTEISLGFFVSLHVSLQIALKRAIWGYIGERQGFFYQNLKTLEPIKNKGSEVNLSP
jgi:hypothetical protein